MPMWGRLIHSLDAEVTFQKYNVYNDAIYSISRNELNQLLLLEAESVGVKIHFNHEIKRVGIDEIDFIINNEEKTEHYDFLVGADGVYSKVRAKIDEIENDHSSIEKISHGYVELKVTAGYDDLKNDGLHIWPRSKFMLIALPNRDDTFTCTLFLPFKGPQDSFEALSNKDEIKCFLKKNFSDIYENFDLTDAYQKFNDPNGLAYLIPSKWSSNKLMIMGDAAHSIVPFYGQGMNAGFQNCLVFKSLLESGLSLFKAAHKLEELRYGEAEAISRMALNNFEEMQSKTADKHFFQSKKLDQWLHKEFSNLWIPEYHQVSFSNGSYVKAMLDGEFQKVFLQKILNKGFFSDPDQISEKEKNEILAQLKNYIA